MTPTVGVAGCERYLAVVCENDQAFGAWLLEVPEAVPVGGVGESMLLTRMWATVEDWNARFGGATMRLLFCAPHDARQENRVFQRRTAQAMAVTEERLAELLALERAQQERRASTRARRRPSDMDGPRGSAAGRAARLRRGDLLLRRSARVGAGRQRLARGANAGLGWWCPFQAEPGVAAIASPVARSASTRRITPSCDA